MSAYRQLTETLRDQVQAALWRSGTPNYARPDRETWSRALALLEEELRVMGDDE